MYTESEHERALSRIASDAWNHKPMHEAWLPDDFDALDAEMERRGHLYRERDTYEPTVPLVLGGQGREDADVESEGVAVGALLLMLAAGAALVLVARLIGGGL